MNTCLAHHVSMVLSIILCKQVGCGLILYHGPLQLQISSGLHHRAVLLAIVMNRHPENMISRTVLSVCSRVHWSVSLSDLQLIRHPERRDRCCSLCTSLMLTHTARSAQQLTARPTYPCTGLPRLWTIQGVQNSAAIARCIRRTPVQLRSQHQDEHLVPFQPCCCQRLHAVRQQLHHTQHCQFVEALHRAAQYTCYIITISVDKTLHFYGLHKVMHQHTAGARAMPCGMRTFRGHWRDSTCRFMSCPSCRSHASTAATVSLSRNRRCARPSGSLTASSSTPSAAADGSAGISVLPSTAASLLWLS